MFPMSLLVKDKFSSIDRASDINAPTLILMAELDKTIPKKNTENLISKIAPELLKTVVVRNASHNDILDSELYATSISLFLE